MSAPRCSAMAPGRHRCTADATTAYQATRIRGSRRIVATYFRCDAHPLGNAIRRLPLRSLIDAAPRARREA